MRCLWGLSAESEGRRTLQREIMPSDFLIAEVELNLGTKLNAIDLLKCGDGLA